MNYLEKLDILSLINHAFIHTISLLPFLLIIFIVIEILACKFSNKHKILLIKKGKFGSLFAGFFGLIPQCGFGVVAANLYSKRLITLGALISIFLTTSDEMIPILISANIGFDLILKILGIKLLIGISCGFIIDFILRKKQKLEPGDLIHEEHYHCPKGILRLVWKHIVHTLGFIFIIYLTLDIIYELGLEHYLENLLMLDTIFAPFIAGLIGLIPSCGSSVMITQFYLLDAISFGTMIGALLVNSGLSLIVLFKTNKCLKTNLIVLSIIYFIGVLSGILINFLNII